MASQEFTEQEKLDAYLDFIDYIGATIDPHARNVVAQKFQGLSQQEQDELFGAIGTAATGYNQEREVMANYLDYVQQTGRDVEKLRMQELENLIPRLETVIQHFTMMQQQFLDLGAILEIAEFPSDHVEVVASRWGVQERALRQYNADLQVAKQRLEKLQNQKAERDEFINAPLGAPHGGDFGKRWRGGEFLGAGNGTLIGLWVQMDKNGNIKDRIVKKNDRYPTRKWRSSHHWDGDAEDLDNRKPMEFALQDMCAKNSPDHFVGMRGWSQDPQKHIVTLYTYWCAHGDLHKVERLSNTFPEPAVWMIFLRLIEACLVMRQGTIDTSQADPDHWEVVHRDFKYSNIFMDIPDKDFFPLYPAPKLADFGLALWTHKTDDYNPHGYGRGGGTHPYRAPEQVSNTIYPDVQYGSHTNVYSLGAVLYNLISEGGMNTGPDPDFTKSEQRQMISQWTRDHYTPELIGLIDGMLEWDPQRRPDLDSLYATAKSYIHDEQLSRDEEVIQYVQNATWGSQAPRRPYELLYPEDEYKVGLAWGPAEASSQATGGVKGPPQPFSFKPGDDRARERKKRGSGLSVTPEKKSGKGLFVTP